jgi:hypothetical protein
LPSMKFTRHSVIRVWALYRRGHRAVGAGVPSLLNSASLLPLKGNLKTLSELVSDINNYVLGDEAAVG